VKKKQLFNISFCVLNYACQCQEKKKYWEHSHKNVTVHSLCVTETNDAVSTTLNLSAALETQQWIFICIVLGLQNIYHTCEQCKRTFLSCKMPDYFFPILDKFWFSRRSSTKDSNINIHENISRWRRVDKAYRQTDEQARLNYRVPTRLDHLVLLPLF